MSELILRKFCVYFCSNPLTYGSPPNKYILRPYKAKFMNWIEISQTASFATVTLSVNTASSKKKSFDILLISKTELTIPNTYIPRLTTGIRSEKCVVRRFRRCANVIECTYTNLDSIAYYTPKLYGIAYCSSATNLYSMLLYWVL